MAGSTADAQPDRAWLTFEILRPFMVPPRTDRVVWQLPGVKGENIMKTIIGMTLAACLVSAPAFAKHWHEDHGHWKKHQKHHDEDDRRDADHRGETCYFHPHDVQVISEYYAPRYRALPPGLQKKYYRTGHLPPGWEKRIEPIPVVVERRLIPVPIEYRRGIIDGYVVLYSPRTLVMIDVSPLFGLK
jgi:hypothetical protein